MGVEIDSVSVSINREAFGRFLTGYLDTPVLCIYLLKPNRVIVPGEIHENYPGKNIYRKDPKFSDRLSGQTVQTEISLLLRNRSD